MVDGRSLFNCPKAHQTAVGSVLKGSLHLLPSGAQPLLSDAQPLLSDAQPLRSAAPSAVWQDGIVNKPFLPTLVLRTLNLVMQLSHAAFSNAGEWQLM